MSGSIAPDAFRVLMRNHAAGVVVITMSGDAPRGFTATSFSSVSLDPPIASFCASRTSSCWPSLQMATHVGVHLLGVRHIALARAFATPGRDRFASVDWCAGPHGVPVLADVDAVLVCEKLLVRRAGDHAIVLVSPVSGEAQPDPGPPLVYHMGRYLSLTTT